MAKAIQKAKIIPAEKTGGNRSYRFLYEGIVFLFAFLLFANSISNDYNLDDELVTRNHRLTSKGISAIPEIFTSPYYEDMSGYSYEYRPIVLVSFAIEHEFFGDDAHWSHFINVFLYALTCLILFRVLRLLFNGYSPLLSAAVCLLYAAHPAHTEVVCSIKNRDEILGLLFGLLALSYAVTAVRQQRLWLIFAVFSFFVMGLLCKVTIVSFCLIIPLGLILFTNVNIKWLIYFTLALVIPACFITNLGGGIVRLEILFSLIFISLGFFLWHKSDRGIETIKVLIGDVWVQRTKKQFDHHLLSFGAMLQSVLPDKDIWSISSACLSFFAAALYCIAIWGGFNWLAYIPFSVLIILAWLGNKKYNWWASVMITVSFTASIAIIAMSGRYGPNDEWFRQLFSLYLGYQLFYGKKGQFIPTLICFAVTNYLMIIPEHNHNWTGLFALVMVFLIFKYVRILLVFIAFGGAIIQIYNGQASFLSLLNLAASMMVVFSIHYGKIRSVVVPVLAFVLVIVFHTSQSRQISNLPLKSAVTTIDRQLVPQTISKTQNRPLSYIEEVIDIKTPFSIRAGTSLEILFNYLSKVVLPNQMSFYYGYNFIYPQKINDAVPILSLIIHLALIILALMLFRNLPLVAFAILVYLISIVVFSNYTQPIPGMLAERFLLIPSLGWTILLGWAIGVIAFRRVKPAIANEESIPTRGKYLFGAILLLYSGITFSRNFDWKDDLTLFRHDILYVDQSAQAHNLLALHLMQHTEREPDINQKTLLEKEALLHFKKAKEIYPYFFNIAYDIGRVYTVLNMQDSAIEAFKYSLTLDTTLSDDYLSLSSLLLVQSRYSEAIPYLESVIKLMPDQYIGYDKLSFAYFQIRQLDKSIETNLRAIQHVQNQADPFLNMGRVYLAKNERDSARVYLIKAGQMAPGNAEIQQLLQQTAK